MRTLFLTAFFSCLLCAQGPKEDYERANALRDKLQSAALHQPGPATWVGESNRFWYRRTVQGGAEFILVDAENGTKRPAFDHARVAAAIGSKYKANTLPFNEFNFAD